MSSGVTGVTGVTGVAGVAGVQELQEFKEWQEFRNAGVQEGKPAAEKLDTCSNRLRIAVNSLLRSPDP
jgi:hypothetical protein